MLNVLKVSLIFEGDEFRGFTVFQLDFDLGIGESLELYILGYNFDLYKLFIIRGFMSLVHQVLASGTDAEDEKKAVGMPSFDPQVPISNAMYSSPSITF
ncbi:hypothetical protein D5086_007521, partial [Populus alba]